MHKTTFSIGLIILLILSSCTESNKQSTDSYIAIINGSILNFKNLDNLSFEEGMYILIKDSEIIIKEKYTEQIKFPKNTKIIDAKDKYLIPGLIDGFAALNNQSYANAYLYSGITSIIAVDGGRRGPFFGEASPGPDYFRLESVGDDHKTTKEHIQDLENLYKNGYKIALLKYELRPEQVQKCVERSKELGMGTIGEFGFTSYKKACEIGVNAFVHTTRYSLDAAPENMRNAVATEPFSDDLNSAKWKYYQYLANLKMNTDLLNTHAEVLGNCKSFLMPTMSLLYLDLPESKNPWNENISSILDAEDIYSPANKTTGKHDYTKNVQDNYTAMALQELKIENKYYSSGAQYLSGSATDVWGTMPGISLHTELALLKRIGMSNSEVIQAATINFHKAFGWNIGKLEKGFEADILILDENPLSDINNLKSIHSLINNGEMIEIENLLIK